MRTVEASSYKLMDKYLEELQNNTYTCKCGHRVVIPKNKTKRNCNWCGRSVFKSKRDEFIYKMETKLYGRKNK